MMSWWWVCGRALAWCAGNPRLGPPKKYRERKKGREGKEKREEEKREEKEDTSKIRINALLLSRYPKYTDILVTMMKLPLFLN